MGGDRIVSARVKLLTGVALALFAAPLLFAQTPVLTPKYAACVTPDGNALVRVNITPETGWSSVRAYFRRTANSDFYFLEMRSDGAGNYWATLPLPEQATREIDVQVAVRDAEGKETRAQAGKIPVSGGCAETLTTEQQKFAQNLVVGETMAGQKGTGVLGFRCTGIISRIDSTGQMRPDDYCRGVLVAAATSSAPGVTLKDFILPGSIVLGTAGGIAIVREDEKPECSCVCPPCRP
ncbi:MAG: hypothetical protein ACOY3Y_00825 [Acidobacteriota bacterium]